MKDSENFEKNEISETTNFGLVFNKYPRRRPTRYSIDWEEIQNAYIFAEPILHKETNSHRYPTLGEIGAMYGVSAAAITLKSRKTKPSWHEQRKLYHEKTRQLHDLEYGVMQLRRSSEFDSHNLRRLDKFSSIFDVWLEDLEESIVHPDPENGQVMGIKDMREAMTVMKDMHKLNRDILGEPVNYYEFYKEKMKLEREKVEKGEAVTRNEIRDLISAVRKETNEDAQAKLTLDVSVDEEDNMRNVTEFVDDE